MPSMLSANGGLGMLQVSLWGAPGQGFCTSSLHSLSNNTIHKRQWHNSTQAHPIYRNNPHGPCTPQSPNFVDHAWIQYQMLTPCSTSILAHLAFLLASNASFLACFIAFNLSLSACLKAFSASFFAYLNAFRASFIALAICFSLILATFCTSLSAHCACFSTANIALFLIRWAFFCFASALSFSLLATATSLWRANSSTVAMYEVEVTIKDFE